MSSHEANTDVTCMPSTARYSKLPDSFPRWAPRQAEAFPTLENFANSHMSLRWDCVCKEMELISLTQFKSHFNLT